MTRTQYGDVFTVDDNETQRDALFRAMRGIAAAIELELQQRDDNPGDDDELDLADDLLRVAPTLTCAIVSLSRDRRPN